MGPSTIFPVRCEPWMDTFLYSSVSYAILQTVHRNTAHSKHVVLLDCLLVSALNSNVGNWSFVSRPPISCLLSVPWRLLHYTIGRIGILQTEQKEPERSAEPYREYAPGSSDEKGWLYMTSTNAFPKENRRVNLDLIILYPSYTHFGVLALAFREFYFGAFPCLIQTFNFFLLRAHRWSCENVLSKVEWRNYCFQILKRNIIKYKVRHM